MKKNCKRRMNLTKHYFFCCIYFQNFDLFIPWYFLPKLKKFTIDCAIVQPGVVCVLFLLYVNRITNYLHSGLMSHSNNLENIKVPVTFTTRKPRSPNIWQTKVSKFFSLQFCLFLRGERGALKEQLLKVQFSELQYSW